MLNLVELLIGQARLKSNYYNLVIEMDDKESMIGLINAVYEELPAPKPKKKKK